MSGNNNRKRFVRNDIFSEEAEATYQELEKLRKQGAGIPSTELHTITILENKQHRYEEQIKELEKTLKAFQTGVYAKGQSRGYYETKGRLEGGTNEYEAWKTEKLPVLESLKEKHQRMRKDWEEQVLALQEKLKDYVAISIEENF